MTTRFDDGSEAGVVVDHEPVWVPAELPINAEGDTRPGYVCVHELENGMGQCGGNVFDPSESTGRHACVLPDAMGVTFGAMANTTLYRAALAARSAR